MAGSHAITGAASWIAVTCTVPGALGLAPLPLHGIVLGAAICASAALLPEADHPQATSTRAMPILRHAGAHAINGMIGGHRRGAHALATLPIIALLAWLPHFAVAHPTWWPGPLWWGFGLVTTLLAAFALKSLRLFRSAPATWLASITLGTLTAFFAPDDPARTSLAIMLGVITHLLGDLLTLGGLPLLWPVNPKPPDAWTKTRSRYLWMPNGHIALPLLGPTGSTREWVLTGTIALYATAILGAQFLHDAGVTPTTLTR